MANIRLNMLPVSKTDFSFKVYRSSLHEGTEKEEGVYQFNLYATENAEDRDRFLVSLEPRIGFEEYIARSHESFGLTKKMLLHRLLNHMSQSEEKHKYELKRYLAEEAIEFTIYSFPEGSQIISLSPFYLDSQKIFGFVIDFKFSKNPKTPFSKEIQKLSLSLDQIGRSNKNYYTDKYKLISNFIDTTLKQFSNIGTNIGEELYIKLNLIETPVFQLNKKEYIFQNRSIANSQFQGVRSFGPYKNIGKEVIFVFIFENRFRSFANELYLSLVGRTNPGTFPGLESMFGMKMDINNVKQIKITGYSDHELYGIVQKFETLQNENSSSRIIGIYIEDHIVNENDDDASHYYYFLKYNFIRRNIPLQVVNYRKLSEKNALKWSTSNLALAMFAKAGGIPWLVKPSNTKCLILGLGSAHKRDTESGKIEKYFAYTVCLDSTGLYQTLEILADDTSNENYLANLKANLITLLKTEKLSNYETCVLHLPFKIKQKEIQAISEALHEIQGIDFIVMKINLVNKFFGFSSHNTLVPYESSFIRLSTNEYLIWFEGLLYGKEIVDKRLANPIHIQFLNAGTSKGFDERKFLQDVLNLSGANWRGFNAKSVPISIYYSQLISKYTQEFKNIDGYDDKQISNDRPWFL